MKKQSNNIVILKANSYFSNKNFDKVIHLLEPEIFNHRDNFLFYYILGISYLYKNDIESANLYLKRANQLDEQNIPVLIGLAFINLKKGQFDVALKTYLEIIDNNPNEKTAKRGLNFIRRNVYITNNKKNFNLQKLLPEIKSHRGLAIILSVSLFVVAMLIGISILFLNVPSKSNRPEIANLQIPNNELQLIDYEVTNKYILTELEIKKTFEKAKKYFIQYRDNPALVEINRLLNSNASQEVKSLALILKKYYQKPDFSNIKDSFKFSVIDREPFLFDGCYVVWRGKIGNLQINNDMIVFDLWIGDEHEFEGVIQVLLNFAFLLENGQEIEILGEISYKENTLILKGTAIHKILL